MANSISSTDITISTAIEVLGSMLAPLGAFSKNFANEYAGRGTTVKVPIVKSSATARDYSATGSNAGYEVGADSDVSTVNIAVTEVIKPFYLSDNELYKSPVNLQNYIQANANAFAKFLLEKVKTEIETNGGTATATKAGTAFDLTTVKALVKKLDTTGTSVTNRHLVLSSNAHNNLLPSTQDTYGQNQSVMQSGNLGSIYGMNVHQTSVLEQGATASKATGFACASDGLVLVNRLPETQGRETLQAYESFTIPNLGLNVAYREHFNSATGTLHGCFTTLFGVKVGNPDAIAWVKGA
jgi:hypothetical protein